MQYYRGTISYHEAMTQNRKGRAALITGGLTGQGFAIAQALAAKGANVAVGSYIGASKGRSEVAALAAFPCGGEAGALLPKTSRSPAAPCGEHLAMARPKIIIDTIMY